MTNGRLALALALLACSPLVAGDWPQFRGPNGSGIGAEKGLPVNWGPTDNVKWKTDLPGRSVASPVVFGKKVFVSTASGSKMDRLHVLCLDADTGKILWHRQLSATGNTACHPTSSMAAGTPCVHADGVYCLFATADLVAYDLDGNLKWYRSLVGDYAAISNQVGMGASPILANDSTLIVPMDTVGDSFLAAIDTKYGQNIWKADRPREIGWVTPSVRTVGERTEVICSCPKEAVAYNVADGKKSWSIPKQGASVPTATVVGDRVLLPTNAGASFLSIDGPEPKEGWKSAKLQSGYTSPLVYKERVYSIGRAGTLSCVDLKTGREAWEDAPRISKGKGQFWASPLANDGFIYTFDDAGIGTVIEAGGTTARIVSVNDLKEEVLGTPALANGAMYIQTSKGIYCIAAKSK